MYQLCHTICWQNWNNLYLRLNNHRKYSNIKDAILACTYFQSSNHIFKRDVKFILIEQIRKKYNNIEGNVHLKKAREFLDLKSSHTLSRWFKSRTKQCMTSSFAVVICSTLSTNASTIGNWRPE